MPTNALINKKSEEMKAKFEGLKSRNSSDQRAIFSLTG